MIENRRCIGLKFFSDKVVNALVNQLPQVSWSDQYGMVYIDNTPGNLDLIFKTFRGVAWINCNYFYGRSSFGREREPVTVETLREKEATAGRKACPENYLRKLELKCYAANTIRTYVSCFESFINYYDANEIDSLNENDIRLYLQKLIKENKSQSYVNQAVNSIKFYYEVVLEMPNRFYAIERPRKEEKLPQVLSKQEVVAIIENTNNLKHRCIVSLLYSAGLRRSEVLALRTEDIDSKRMVIRVRQGKGNKDRYTILSENLLKDLRQYFLKWRPSSHLFEGPKGEKYSAESVLKIVKEA